MDKNEKLVFGIPNSDTMPCRTCKHKCFGVMDYFCLAYKFKPDNVYYKSEPCPKYEEKKPKR